MRRRALCIGLVLTLLAGACGGDDAADDGGGGGGGGATTTSVRSGPPTGVFSIGTNDLTAGSEPVPGGTFVFGLESDSDGLDPMANAFALSGHFEASAIFDSLADVGPDGEVVPHLAEKISYNEPFTQWTITLRDGVTFHDGTPVDAAAVKATFDGFMASPLVQNALRDVKTVTVVDPLTVRVDMKKPWSAFDFMLTTQVGYVVAPAMLEDPKASINPVGSGPFIFEDWVIGKELIARKNPKYWRKDAAGRQLPYVDELRFTVVADDSARQAAVLTGDVDAMHTDYPPSIAELLRSDDEYQVHVDAAGEEEFVMLNLADEPFNEMLAREALAYGTDREAYAETTGGGVLVAVNGPFVPGQLGYEEDTGYPDFDLATAKEKVKAYEAKTGKKLKFSLQSVPTPQGLVEIQLLADQWKQAGMEVEIKTNEQAAHVVNVALGQYEAAYWRMFSSVDPDGDSTWWHGDNAVDPPGISLNFARVRDPEMDKAIDATRAWLDDDTRDEQYRIVARRMAALKPYIWLTRTVWVLAARKNVGGLARSTDGGLGSLGSKTWLAEVWVAAE